MSVQKHWLLTNVAALPSNHKDMLLYHRSPGPLLHFAIKTIHGDFYLCTENSQTTCRFFYVNYTQQPVSRGSFRYLIHSQTMAPWKKLVFETKVYVKNQNQMFPKSYSSFIESLISLSSILLSFIHPTSSEEQEKNITESLEAWAGRNFQSLAIHEK